MNQCIIRLLLLLSLILLAFSCGDTTKVEVEYYKNGNMRAEYRFDDKGIQQGTSRGGINNSGEDKQSLSKDTVVVDSSLASLVQDVLSLPAVVKLSKADLVRKEYGMLYVWLGSDHSKINDSILYQGGLPIKVIAGDKAGKEIPCYVFEKIKMHGNSAYIVMKFAITGFVSRGKLKYSQGKWVPEETFVVGYQ